MRLSLSKESARHRALFLAAAVSTLLLPLLPQMVRAGDLTVCPSGCNATTIQGALTLASAGDTIHLATSLPHIEKDIFILQSVTIEGFAGQFTTLQADVGPQTAGTRVLTIVSGATVVIRDLDILYGDALDDGGAIYNQGDLTLDNVMIGSSFSGFRGGCIYNEGLLTLRDSWLQDCFAERGGAIYNNQQGTVVLDDVNLAFNNAEGGAQLYNRGEASILDSTLGSGISSKENGGAIANQGSLRLDRSRISNGVTPGRGGGLYQLAGETVVTGGSVLNCESDLEGAGFAVVGGTLWARDVVFTGNDALSDGGGLFVSGDASVHLQNAELSDNTALRGAALFTRTTVPPQLHNLTMSGNEATEDGGAIYVYGSRAVEIASSTIAFNEADSDADTSGDGGGIFLGTESCGQPLCAATRASLRNTILASNEDLSPGVSTAHDCDGELTSDGYNLIEVAGNAIPDSCNVDGDLTGVIIGVDPLLEALANNGGEPATTSGPPPFSHALGAASQAVDAGDPGGCFDYGGALLNRDQRYGLRVGRCDIGAYEYGSESSGLVIFEDGFESGGTTAWSATMP